MSKQGIRCIVAGKVQGVWFRYYTQQEAERLGLIGWAKNQADGTVEVIAMGEATELEQLYQWLHQGSPKSTVNTVSYEEYNNMAAINNGFQIL